MLRAVPLARHHRAVSFQLTARRACAQWATRRAATGAPSCYARRLGGNPVSTSQQAIALTMHGANAASHDSVGGMMKESAAGIGLVQKASHHPPHRRCLIDKWNRRYPG